MYPSGSAPARTERRGAGGDRAAAGWHDQCVRPGGQRVGYASVLRVYEPLAVFPVGERERWQGWLERRGHAAAAGRGPRADDPSAAAAAEHEAALAMLVRPTLDAGEEAALVLVLDGLTYLSPAGTQRRVWEALAEFRGGLADVVADAFVPAALAEQAAEELARSLAAAAMVRPPHVLTATWHVPLPWLIAMEADEVEIRTGDVAGRGIRATTAMGRARRRVARAVDLLTRALPDAPTLRALEELGRWLEGFDAQGKVQLDYAGLATQLSDDFLATDTSVADLAQALQALRRGDGREAGEAYERVVARWRPVQARETAS